MAVKKKVVKKSVSTNRDKPKPPPGGGMDKRTKAAVEYMERNMKSNPKQYKKINKKINKTAAGLTKARNKSEGKMRATGLRGGMGMGGGALGAYKK